MKYKLTAGIIATLLGLYSLVWGFYAIQFESAKNLYKTNLTIASSVELYIKELEPKSPHIWLPILLDDIQLQQIANQDLNNALMVRGLEIDYDTTYIIKDNNELLRQSKNLGLSDNSIQETKVGSLPIDYLNYPNNVLAVYNKKLDEQKKLETQKALITDFYLQQKKENKFANPLWGYTDSELHALTDNLTNYEKAGQFLIFSISEQYSNSSFIKNLTDTKPGGIIYMGGNVVSPTQLKDLSQAIQNSNPRIPLFIATDQEGGVVKRISWDTTSGQNTWDKMTVGELCSQAKQRGKTLSDAGINLNFSPVVDLSILGGGYINNRTISTDPLRVVEKAQEYVNCLQSKGVIATLKHYPGHGATTEDSHYKLPIINKSKEDWLNSDAIPFKTITNAKAIMLGHLMFTQIDSQAPSTLSNVLINDILRNEFGYKGLIITDDMNMLHTSTNIGVKETMQRAINAGVNQLLYVGFPESKEDLLNILTQLIESGGLEPTRVEESLLKILQTKRDLVGTNIGE
jgi:beta-N-acetylhexosaminidase